MAFQTRSSLPASAAADNWSKGVSNAGSKWADGYANPRRDPQANALASAAAWKAGVDQAQSLYQANLASYSSDAAIAKAKAVGAGRYTQAATASKANYAKVANVLVPALRSIQLPSDRSTLDARIARSAAQIRGAAQLRGKYRKSNVNG